MRVRILISGRVHGVGFRYWVKRQAERLGVGGWVRNMDDGRVAAELRGQKKAVERMIRQCKQGPPLSRVDQVETELIDDKWQGEEEFVILK